MNNIYYSKKITAKKNIPSYGIKEGDELTRTDFSSDFSLYEEHVYDYGVSTRRVSVSPDIVAKAKFLFDIESTEFSLEYIESLKKDREIAENKYLAIIKNIEDKRIKFSKQIESVVDKFTTANNSGITLSKSEKRAGKEAVTVYQNLITLLDELIPNEQAN